MVYLSILIGYALLMILLGFIFSRRVQTSSDFYVARRELTAGLLFSTLLAANIGAGSTVGATGLGYRDGLAAWWWVGSAGIGSLVLALTVGPRIWEVAREQGLYTVGDYLEFRFDRRVRAVVSLLLWIGSLAILAGQLMAIAWILQVTIGLAKPIGCLLGAVVATIYFTAGGLAGTARVNAVQLVIKLLGFGLALGWLLADLDGWSQFRQVVEARGGADHFDLLGEASRPGWLYLILLGPSFVVSPGLLQKIFGARDRGAVRRGVAWNALVLLVFAGVPVFFGMMALARYPGLANRELAMPMLLTESLPVWLGGLLLGALFAAEVSTADTVIFMLSTSVTRDLYQLYLDPAADDRRLMRVTRWVAVFCGLGGALVAILLDSVIAALTIFYTLMTAALFLPIIAGLYLPRVGARAALLSILAAVGLTVLLEAIGRLARLPVPVSPLVWGILLGGLVMLLSARRSSSPPH
jgi:SSS family solute:Na+ symporter